MIKEPPSRTNIVLQKRRSSVALSIRITLFLGVVIFYGIYRSSIFGKTDEAQLSQNFGRKLLSIIPQSSTKTAQTLNLVNNKNINTTSFAENLTETTTFSLLNITLNESESVTNFSNESKKNKSFSGEVNCTLPAINEFPSDGFTREQRKQGWIVIHVLLACYCFWLLAAVCDDYFVPAIEQMCSSFQMKEDVIGATFMAAAVSSPELFINCVGTFVTKTDLGVGTIVGSAVFNILAVPACCGLFAGQMTNLDWWPVSRDCLMYCFAVLGLIAVLADGKVMWYEALLLVLAYFIYVTAMYCNDVMARKARKLISKFRRRSKARPFREVSEITPLFTSGKLKRDLQMMEPVIPSYTKSTTSLDTIHSDNSIESIDFADDPWSLGDRNFVMYILRWPITFLLWITVPDCRKHPKLRYVTFFLAVCWIGAVSYFVAFFITFVGDTLNIPDSVMGLTILAAGMSIPEAVSSVIVTSQGHGAMGISNSIGSNTFDILLCLGLPWLIKAYFVPAVPNENWVVLNSSGLTYSTISLLTTLFGLYIAFVANKFCLDWKIGISCTIMYVGFLVLASMIELNYFFNVNLPVCKH